jgi:hypothetical protein
MGTNAIFGEQPDACTATSATTNTSKRTRASTESLGINSRIQKQSKNMFHVNEKSTTTMNFTFHSSRLTFFHNFYSFI